MAQDFEEIQGGDTLTESRPTINDNFEAIRTLHSGSVEPPATTRVGGMLWIDTAAGKLKIRALDNLSWIELGDISAELGHLSLSKGGQTMTKSFSMGGNPIEGVGQGGADSAARKADVDAKAPIASPLFTGDPRVSQNPAGPQSIAPKSHLDATYLAKAGGLAIGRIGTSSVVAAGASEFLKLSEIAAFVGFNLATGHRHNGVDAPRVSAFDLTPDDVSGLADVDSITVAQRIVGSYTGDGTNDRTISLPWRPSLVAVGATGGTGKILAVSFDLQGLGLYSNSAGTFGDNIAIVLDDNEKIPEITAQGFRVSSRSGSRGLNDTGAGTYNFLALK